MILSVLRRRIEEISVLGPEDPIRDLLYLEQIKIDEIDLIVSRLRIRYIYFKTER